MKRAYHPYWNWEEYHAGMWRIVSKAEEKQFLSEAITFTGNAKLYGSFMVKVANEWKVSCEHNLTCEDMNRKAWIGHAATCLAINCPEYITRMAWAYLTDKQRDEANYQAQKAIELWENLYNEQLSFKFCA